MPRARIAAARVLVVGDVMLDRYWFGDVNRISPEAPVPVVHVRRKEDRLGGAANVARNAAALGAQAGLLCVVGHDEPGERIVELLGESRVAAYLERDPELLTTIKLRVLSRQQQLLRVDFENMPTHEVLIACLERFDTLLAQHDVILMSDYAKGGLTHVTQMIDDAKRAGKPCSSIRRATTGIVIAAPRSSRRTARNCARSWGLEVGRGPARARHEAARGAGFRCLLLTRSEEGMTLFTEPSSTHQPMHAKCMMFRVPATP